MSRLLLMMLMLLLVVVVVVEMGVVLLLMITDRSGGHGHRGRRSGRRTVIFIHFEPYARGGIRLLETRQLEPRTAVILLLLLLLLVVVDLRLLLFGRVCKRGVHVRQRVDLLVQRQLGIRTGQQFGKTARRECGLCLE